MKSKKKRMNFVFDAKLVKVLRTLREDYAASSDAETIRNALALAHYINRYLKKGYDLKLDNCEETINVISPIFPVAADGADNE